MFNHGHYATNCANSNGWYVGLRRATSGLAFLLWFSALTCFADVPVSLWAGTVVVRTKVHDEWYYPLWFKDDTCVFNQTSNGGPIVTSYSFDLWSRYTTPHLVPAILKVVQWRDEAQAGLDKVYVSAFWVPAGTVYESDNVVKNSAGNRLDLTGVVCFVLSNGFTVTGLGSYALTDQDYSNIQDCYYPVTPNPNDGNYFGAKVTIIINTWLTTFFQSFDPGTMTSETINSEDFATVATATSGAGGALVVDPTGASVDDTSLVRDFDKQAGVADNNGLSGITTYLGATTATTTGGGKTVTVGWDPVNMQGLIPNLSFELPTSLTFDVPAFHLVGTTPTLETSHVILQLSNYRDGLAGVRFVMTLIITFFGAIASVFAVMAIFKLHF